MSSNQGKESHMTKKAKQIEPHFADLVKGVHEDLHAKGIQGVQVTAIHFAAASPSPCPPGMKWDCRDDPGTGGVKCGCFPI
jgi:hypothetical protein